MNQINLKRLIETPFMMEIIVQVLSSMLIKASEKIRMKQNFINNFQKMFKAFLKRKYLIQMYQQLQNKKIQNDILEVTQTDIQNLEESDYNQKVTLKVWNRMEENSIPYQLQISQEFKGLNNIILKIIDSELLFQNNTFNKVKIENDSLRSLVWEALTEQNLTSFDFYSQFIDQYYLKQIKNFGKSINIVDIQRYSINLAKNMSFIVQLCMEQFKNKLIYSTQRSQQCCKICLFFS
ncbi:unnamed protein product [Paramecium sonneborni]|uniref:Uncharacterized protein n=1 Tax=Paramecium sonneborni TaxID=65129 RepID=A0A8S1RRS0_9CILI|nr:unnamed protein product [Paramecium sonneborni]